ncbi:ATP-dependent RNA helicase HrpB [Raoultella terrigena]|uniref:ATP-dependent RNA helicase HrpB n=1 Tax=Raoultella terrigena TaxID=577 RepID=A0A485AYR9_RAOTE|nr:ATP-dependent RNA helicase HrpB [Raoultella terrigena]
MSSTSAACRRIWPSPCCLDVQQGLRDDLKLLIMSATLDNDRLQRMLPQAPVVTSAAGPSRWEKRYQALAAHQRFDGGGGDSRRRAAAPGEAGRCCCFSPASAKFSGCRSSWPGGWLTMWLSVLCTGRWPLSEQRKAILPAAQGMRKVVLATNIAETSLTIEGIRLVVDSAQERVARFDARTGLTRLITQRISQASMTQRAGRAGRLEPGICLHLIAKEQAERAAAQSDPEILQSDLSSLLLELLQWGCQDPAELRWLDLPPEINLAAARRLLTALSALEGGRLSAPRAEGWPRWATIRALRRC